MPPILMGLMGLFIGGLMAVCQAIRVHRIRSIFRQWCEERGLYFVSVTSSFFKNEHALVVTDRNGRRWTGTAHFDGMIMTKDNVVVNWHQDY